MRDYGKVHTSFWHSDTLAGLSDDAKFLALYLLTCPHGNMAGVFRLPTSYAAEDTGWDSERLANGFKTLSDSGWMARDERTGWTWVRKFCKWNKPDNPNQQKAVDKLLDAVPDSVSFHAELIAPSKSEGTVSEPLGNTPVPAPVSVPVPEGFRELPKIPLDDGTEFAISVELLAEFKAAYPRVDIPGELGKARAWGIANPAKRKTRRGVIKHLNTWLAGAAEKAPAAAAPAAGPGGGRQRLA